MAVRRSLLIFMALLLVAAARAAPPSERDTLLKFKGRLSDVGGFLASWAVGTQPCTRMVNNWLGLRCDSTGKVAGMRIERMNLTGKIDVDLLHALPRLRTISMSGNSFHGPMPAFGKLLTLRALHLSRNKFSGEIHGDAFSGMRWLKILRLADNAFSGQIPRSLGKLPKLLDVRLEDNQFAGAIPDFHSKELITVNFTNNNLEGIIPKSLRGMKPEFFAGNKGLCGHPLGASCSSILTPGRPTKSPPSPLTPAVAPSSSSSSQSTTMAIAIVAVIALVFIALIVWKHRDTGPGRAGRNAMNAASKEAKLEEGVCRPDANNSGSMRRAGKELDHGKLIFVRENRPRFELLDLLKAQAEVLGNGNFGCSYRAFLVQGSPVVVKRFKNMNRMGREDFDEYMRRMGRWSHPNLLPLVSYYYRKDEKLMVTDYVPRGSLANALHGSDGSDVTPLDWSTRVKIIKGIAKGLNHLYEELQMLSVPHGHLKSSNVLLSDHFEPLLNDYALVPLMNQAHAVQFMVAYKSPEFREYEKTSKKTDVWSLGLLILEILTGKIPDIELQLDKEVDLVIWVSSVAQEDGPSKALDSKMEMSKKGEEEMIKLLQIGLDCCEVDVEKRCELEEALDKIEEIKEKGDEDPTLGKETGT